jgi:hypothetical protein
MTLAAFKAFQSGIRERCIEPPQAGGATIVGNYRMLAAVSNALYCINNLDVLR